MGIISSFNSTFANSIRISSLKPQHPFSLHLPQKEKIFSVVLAKVCLASWCNMLACRAGGRGEVDTLLHLFMEWSVLLWNGEGIFLWWHFGHKKKTIFTALPNLLKINGYCLVAHMVKNLPAVWETQVWSLGWEDPLKKGISRKFHGQRSLVGYSPQGHKELDTTK